MTGPKLPGGLKARGRAYWRSVVADFDLSGSELELLAEICRVLDRLDELAAVLAEEGSVCAGSRGQRVVHPALSEARQQQLVLAQLTKALNVPVDDDEPKKDRAAQARSDRARKAAQRRWGKT